MNTIPHLFLKRVAASAANTAVHFPLGGNHPTSASLERKIDGFANRTWAQLAEDVAKRTQALHLAAIVKNDLVVHIGANSYDWIVTDLAIQFAGAIHVPFHALSTSHQVAQLIEHCRPKMIIASNDLQRQKLSLAEINLAESPEVLTYASLKAAESELPNGLDRNHGLHFLQRALDDFKLNEQDLISILYTSGTTGEPKGVMLSQANVFANVQSKLAVLPLNEKDMRLCLLPMTHIFARVCDVYTWIASGSQLAISQDKKLLFDELTAVRPTYINGVPYFYEKCWRTLRDNDLLDSDTALHDMLGGRVRICNCGGAAMADHVFDYFWSRGIQLVTGYGLTETSPVVSSSTPEKIRRRAVGPAIPGVKIKLADDGEICVSGDNVMQGYFRDESATSKVLRDGWFYTGDIGRIDADGFLYIIGRKKELIVTTGGKNISPVYLESLLNEDPWIDQSIVIGNDRDYLVALIVPNFELANNRLELPDLETTIRKRIDEQLSVVSRHEQIGRFRLLNEPFSIDNQMLTAKSSLRRDEIMRRYEPRIEALYCRDQPKTFSSP